VVNLWNRLLPFLDGYRMGKCWSDQAICRKRLWD